MAYDLSVLMVTENGTLHARNITGYNNDIVTFPFPYKVEAAINPGMGQDLYLTTSDGIWLFREDKKPSLLNISTNNLCYSMCGVYVAITDLYSVYILHSDQEAKLKIKKELINHSDVIKQAKFNYETLYTLDRSGVFANTYYNDSSFKTNTFEIDNCDKFIPLSRNFVGSWSAKIPNRIEVYDLALGYLRQQIYFKDPIICTTQYGYYLYVATERELMCLNADSFELNWTRTDVEKYKPGELELTSEANLLIGLDKRTNSVIKYLTYGSQQTEITQLIYKTKAITLTYVNLYNWQFKT